MARNVLKGVFREGTIVASVIQEDTTASIMVKGAEPAMPRDPAFFENIQKVAQGCAEHVKDFSNRELCAVFLQRPAQAEFVEFGPEDVKGMGLTAIRILDGDCGLAVRVCDTDPLPVPLAYASLRAGLGTGEQPGRVEVPSGITRKTYRDLTPPQRQVFEAAAQISARSLYRLLLVEDPTLMILGTVRDLPPARARTVVIPLSDLAEELAGGKSIEDVAKKLERLRGT